MSYLSTSHEHHPRTATLRVLHGPGPGAGFCVDALGFGAVADASMGDQRWVQVGPKDAGTGVTLVTWFPTIPAGSQGPGAADR